MPALNTDMPRNPMLAVGGVDRRALTGHTSLASRTKTPVSTQTRLMVLYTSVFCFCPLGRDREAIAWGGGAAGLFVPCRSQHLGAAGSKPAAPAGPGALAEWAALLGRMRACFHFRTSNSLT
jgi:hypothetical protein